MTQIRQTRAAQLGPWLSRHPYVLPGLVLLIAAAFRFYNLNWDNGHQLHPDERGIYELLSGSGGNPPLTWPGSIAQFFDVRDPTGGSPLNPHYFAYGSLPYYALALVAGGISLIGQHVSYLSGWSQVYTYGGLPPVGRALSGLLDLLSIVVVFLIGRRVFGYWTGLLAMALTAFTVLEIQLAHFYQVDSLLLPLVLLCLLAAVHISTSTSKKPYIWGGVALGAALATKTTALLLIVPLGAAAILQAWSLAEWPDHGPLLRRLRRHYAAIAPALNLNLFWLLATYLIGAATFAVCEPYGVLDRQLLLTDVSQQSSIIVTNSPPFGVPYTVQYAGTTPYLYQLKNLLFWSMGIPLALAAFAGVVFIALPVLRLKIRPDRIVLLLWVIPYFLFVGRFFAKFDRYMLPIMPIITLFGAALLVWLVRVTVGKRRLLSSAALVAVLGGSFLYSVAYMNVYAAPNTRVAASRWIYAHIPAGTTVAVEGPWDDNLPLPESGRDPFLTYGKQPNIDLYASEDQKADDQAKIANITSVLTQAKYIVMSSERLIGSIPKLPLKYPIANRYYQLLFGNKLNFRLVKVFQVHPQLGLIIVEDYAADESFHVYDHPIVRIFERTGPITVNSLRRLLTTGLPAPPTSVDPATLPWILRPSSVTPDQRLVLSPSQWRADQQGGTLDSMFPAGGFGMQHPIIIWLLLLEILGLIAFPFTFAVFRNLLDRGWVIAKTIGLVLLGYLVWMAVNVGIGVYDRTLIGLSLLTLALLGAALAYRRRQAMLDLIRTRWRYMLAGELVFLAGFAAFVLLRMWYPDLGHQWSPVSTSNVGGGRMGEKQMELAFLNAIVRSRVFPPYDPFFGHGYINYYYYGFFLVGTLCKLTQVVPTTGFNLAIATFFAMLVANVFSCGLSLSRRISVGVLAAIVVGAIGNLNGGWQLIRGLMGVSTVHYSFPFFGGMVNVLYGFREVAFSHQQLPPFDYWESTRIVPGGAISEFPYFTYLFADLHPHLMAYPLTAAALALAVNLVRGGYRGVWSRLLAIVVGGLLVGAIAATNPWDYPTYLLLIGLGAMIGGFALRKRFSPDVLLRPILWLGALAGLSFLFYLPFKQSYQTVFETGIGLVRNISPDTLQAVPHICPDGSNSCPGYIHDILVTPLGIYLEHFGLFLFATLTYLALLVGAATRRRSGGRGVSFRRMLTWIQFGSYYRERLGHVRHAAQVVRRMQASRRDAAARSGDSTTLWALLILLAGLVALRYYLLAFLVTCLGLTTLSLAAFGRRLSPARMFVLSVAGFALLLSILTQIFFVKDFLAGGPAFRMNTIFKFYNQAWVLFSIAGACSLYFFMDRRIPAHRLASAPARPNEPVQKSEGFRGVLRRSIIWPVRRRFVSPSLAYAQGATHSSAVTESPGTPATLSQAAKPNVPGPLPAARPRRCPPRPFALLHRRPFWGVCLAILIAGSFIYTYAGTVAREAFRTTWLPENSVPFTLDGMAFMKVAYPGEYAAIQWINANVRGAPVIAEAGGAYYDWRSRVSMFTGLPTIIDGIHESEQRFGDEIDPTALCGGTRDPSSCLNYTHSRPDDLNTLYDSPLVPEAWRVIRTYGVRYIYVGFSEKQCVKDDQGNPIQCYSRGGLAKFDRMVGHGLRVAYRRQGVTIYEVISP